MKQNITLILLSFNLVVFGQGQNQILMMGYAGGNVSPTEDEFGITFLDFRKGSLHLYDDQEIDMNFNDTDASICDEEGNLLFYFNGININDISGQIMENGDTLNPFNNFGYDLPQGGIIIPWPEHPQKYILFHVGEIYLEQPTFWGFEGWNLHYSVIDMNGHNGLGSVVQRKVPLVIDTLDYGKLAVVRHANGRDWWLAMGESHTNKFYSILIDPFGIHVQGSSGDGPVRVEGIGESFFSPDGTKYVMFSSISFVEGQFIDIYDFDRCTGIFNNHEQIHLENTGGGGGVMISPNSRWLYVSHHTELLQYDLWAEPVASSKQLIADYESFNDPFPTYFHRGFLAPDDKVYITTTSGSQTFHVINEPDKHGADCKFEQPGFRLLCANARSLPTFANYRLGPEDGSVCDSLGIDNVPVSWWRYEQDTLEPNHISFHDLSYHEPVTWFWDFGDGYTSTERHPEHIYALPGEYEVCLTVSNTYGSDTHCKTMYGVTASENPAVQASIWVGPNPVHERLAVALSTQLRSPEFLLYDGFGRLVRRERAYYGLTEVETGTLMPGIYFWELRAGGIRVKSGVVAKGE